MNIVKLTNKIALVSVFLLIYWVFIFVINAVFEFRVLKENLTEMFFLSILGIFAILAGSMVLNIMYNLTAIAEGRPKQSKSLGFIPITLFLLSLGAISGLLYYGDLSTTQKKEEYLISSASDVLAEHPEIVNRLSQYEFTQKYIENAREDISVLSEVEEKFPSVTVIVRDSINGNSVLLGIGRYSYYTDDKELVKSKFILSTSSEEREYINSVLDGVTTKHRFSSHDGRYEIYYPATTEFGTIVIHLSEYSRYGKRGS